MKLVWHDFAWIGDESRTAAQAARCAGRQSKFWEYHDHLYHNQRGFNLGQFSTGNLRSFAVTLGLDSGAFNSCLDRGEDLALIQDELRLGREQGVTSTPVFLMNGQRFAGPRSLEQFGRGIEAELARLGR